MRKSRFSREFHALCQRLWQLALIFSIGLCGLPRACAQIQLPVEMANGGMEDWSDEGQPNGWFFIANPKGGSLSQEAVDVFEGKKSALIDTTASDQGFSDFSNLSMRIDGRPFRGKTVRFRAAVRTTEIADGGRAQLWFRVDRESDQNLVGAFDNMQNRPITSDRWQHYEIVLKVDEDAVTIIAGLLSCGKCKTWFDDATFEIVADETPTTDMKVGATAGGARNIDNKKSTPVRAGTSTVLAKAMADAENAPRQPFFTHWLWLVAIAIGLFAISGIPYGKVSTKPEASNADGPDDSTTRWRFLPKFALRFSVAYWLLYCFPIPLSSLIPKYGYMFQSWYTSQVSSIVTWVAANVFTMQGELVPPNGSGDTTFSYVQVFTVFILALAIAGLWSLVDWRKTDYRITKDLLRSYLRYVLAFWMLSYGLGKVSWGANQFPLISEFQFNKSWGDSSPMNVVWSFMGTSRAYTIFAGLGEVVGAVLIVWRRTAMLGALVIFGVMLNVMMLNFCYDVPVKLFSFHLVCMALYVLLPDMNRLAGILLFNRPTERVDMRPPYAGAKTIWMQRAMKLALLILIVAIPVYQHVNTQVRYLAAQADVPEYFGQYEIVEYKLGGRVVDQAKTDYGWRSVRFLRENEYTIRGPVLQDKITIGFNKSLGRVAAAFTDAEQDNVLEMEPHANSLLPQKTIVLNQLDEERLLLSGKIGAGEIEVTLRRNDNLYRVKDRGFRWINEVPFNR